MCVIDGPRMTLPFAGRNIYLSLSLVGCSEKLSSAAHTFLFFFRWAYSQWLDGVTCPCGWLPYRSHVRTSRSRNGGRIAPSGHNFFGVGRRLKQRAVRFLGILGAFGVLVVGSPFDSQAQLVASGVCLSGLTGVSI